MYPALGVGKGGAVEALILDVLCQLYTMQEIVRGSSAMEACAEYVSIITSGEGGSGVRALNSTHPTHRCRLLRRRKSLAQGFPLRMRALCMYLESGRGMGSQLSWVLQDGLSLIFTFKAGAESRNQFQLSDVNKP